MAKSLSDRIKARAARLEPSQTGKNRATFLALRDDITGALADGWPVKTIWETLHEEGKITFSYQAFRGYVNRLIRSSEPAESVKTPEQPVEPKPEPPPKKEPTISKPDAGISGFSFNPRPNKADLI